MKNDFQRHKRSDSVKWAITGIAMILIIAFLAGVIVAVVTETNPKDWGQIIKDSLNDETPGGVVDGDGNEMDPEAVNVMPAAMAFTSDKAGNTVTIEATITPENATNQNVTWSVAWKNPSSSWASGKTVTDYVTVTPDSSNSKVATVTCVKAFSEQVIVTATAAGNTSVKKTCTVDYEKRVLGIQAFTQSHEGINSYEMFGVNRAYIKPSSGQIEDSWIESSCEDPFTPQYSDGTITPDNPIETAIIAINPDLMAVLDGYGYISNDFATLGNMPMRDITDIYMDGSFAQPGSFLWLMWLIFDDNAFNEEVYQTIGAEYEVRYINTDISNEEVFTTGEFDIALIVNLSDGAQIISAFGINFEYFEIGVTNMTLSQGSIIF